MELVDHLAVRPVGAQIEVCGGWGGDVAAADIDTYLTRLHHRWRLPVRVPLDGHQSPVDRSVLKPRFDCRHSAIMSEPAGGLYAVTSAGCPGQVSGLLAWAAAERADVTLVIASNYLSNPCKDFPKTYSRAMRPIPEVRIVRNRVHARRDRIPTQPTGSDSIYKGWFWVFGHWRNQAYGPGRAMRRPVYINPFLKGPEDRPIQPASTVRVLGGARTRQPNGEE